MSRNDPFEEKTKAYCRSLGLDPDKRVPLSENSSRRYDKDGNIRTQSLWTQYRIEAALSLKPELDLYEGPHTYTTDRGIPVTLCGSHEKQTIEQLNDCLEHGDIIAASLCADGHKGYFQPVGGVIAYKDQISVSGVGNDIACGNAAIKLDIKTQDLKDFDKICHDIHRTISFGHKRHKNLPITPTILDRKEDLKAAFCDTIENKIQKNFGTIGNGNHYADIFCDEEGWVWIGVHFGSRGLGAHIFNTFSEKSGARENLLSPANILSTNSDLGVRYITALNLAKHYAWEGRLYVLEQMRQIIGGNITKTIHNFHNFAFQETHQNQQTWVVRKGSTPAQKGVTGFVGGSMDDCAVIIEGLETQSNQDLLNSTIHGSGRLIPRSQAHNLFRKQDLQKHMKDKNIILYGGDIDEGPYVYRKLNDVLSYHKDSIKILHTLEPLAVFMAQDRRSKG